MKKTLPYLFTILFIVFLLILILKFLTAKQAYVLTKTNIENANQASVFGPFEFIYNKNFPNNFTQSCQVTSDPVAEFKLSTVKNVFSLTPESRLNNKTEYKISISCKNDFNLSFEIKTKDIENYSQEELLQLQTQLDYEVATEMKSVVDRQPWRADLPIIKDQYVITYSQVENRFLVTLSLKPNSTQDKQELEALVKEDLENIAAPNLEIYWK